MNFLDGALVERSERKTPEVAHDVDLCRTKGVVRPKEVGEGRPFVEKLELIAS